MNKNSTFFFSVFSNFCKMVDEIYDELRSGSFPSRRVCPIFFCEKLIFQINVLEFSHYLENYLWPFYDASASTKHTLSVVLMINEKFLEQSPALTVRLFSF